MALGGCEDIPRNPAVMGDCSQSPGNAGSGSGLDRPFRLDSSVALRQLSLDRAVLAAVRRGGATHYVEADPVEDAQRILGQTLEPRVPPTRLRFDFPASAQKDRRGRGESACISRIRPDP